MHLVNFYVYLIFFATIAVLANYKKNRKMSRYYHQDGKNVKVDQQKK